MRIIGRNSYENNSSNFRFPRIWSADGRFGRGPNQTANCLAQTDADTDPDAPANCDALAETRSDAFTETRGDILAAAGRDASANRRAYRRGAGKPDCTG